MEKDTENQARPTLAGEVKQEVKAHLFHNAGFAGSTTSRCSGYSLPAAFSGWWWRRCSTPSCTATTRAGAGLVWGPFSPIYGTGAVVLTVSLNRFYHSHNLVIFLIAMVVGSAIEYATSWGMEYFWGAVAWNYDGTFGSIDGRTNFAFGVMWGMLGLVWVRIVIPSLKRVFSHVDAKQALARVVTAGMSVFLVVDISVTVLALDREGQRAAGVPATTAEQKFFDEYFPDSFMQAHFQNMSVYGKG